MSTLVPIILAGGAGSRLWPVSREFYPKQLLNLAGEDSLLQQAARRAIHIAAPERVLTVTAESNGFTVLDQLREVEPELCDRLILEPTAHNTAAAAALSALYAVDHFEDPILWIGPADPAVADPAELQRGVERAVKAAEAGHVVALGLPGARSFWGLEFIPFGEDVADHPGLKYAAGYQKHRENGGQNGSSAGGAWCSRMFVVGARRLLEILESCAPDLMQKVKEAYAQGCSKRVALRVPRKVYAHVPEISLGEVLMGNFDRGTVLTVNPGWQDVSSWQGVWEGSDKDAAGNVLQGDVLVQSSQNCLVRSDGRLVAVAGVEDLTIVETADAVLVAGRSETGTVSQIVKRLKAAGRSEATNHLKDLRPWGTFSILLEGPRYKIKEIVVNPGASLSLQMHYHRSEHWVVIEGTARVTRGDAVELLGENQSTYIPVGTRHRLENPGRVPLRIIEVQNGSYLGEDDIVRFEDSYGRHDDES